MINEDFEFIIEHTNKQIVIVDTQWVLYRSHYSFKGLENSQGMPIGHIYGLSILIQNLCKLNCEVFLSLEGHCTARKSLVEEYKAQRTDSALGTMFINDYGRINDLTSDLPNVHLIQSDEYESDDVMFSAAKLCEKHNKICYIHTLDKDLYQALSPTTFICTKVTSSGFQDIVDVNSQKYTSWFKDLRPQELPIYRAFKGDSSDNIKPIVDRLPAKFAMDMAKYMYENNGKLEGFKPEKNSVWMQKVINNWQVFLNNYKIMKLNEIPFNFIHKSLPGAWAEIASRYKLTQYAWFMSYILNGGK